MKINTKIVVLFVTVMLIHEKTLAILTDVTAANDLISVNASANAAASASASGIVPNTVGAATNEKICDVHPTSCAIVIPMAISLALQALNLGDARDGANAAADDSACTGSFCAGPANPNNPRLQNPTTTPSGTPTPNLPLIVRSPTINQLLRQAESSLNRFKEMGFEFSKDGNGSITTPDGKKVKGTDFVSAASAKAAGFTDEQIKGLDLFKKGMEKEKSKIDKLLNQIASELEGSGGGRKKNAGSGNDRDKGLDYAKLFAGMNGKNNLQGSRGLAGLEKKHGSDAIGVAQDNIFHMIHRRYNAKQPTLSP